MDSLEEIRKYTDTSGILLLTKDEPLFVGEIEVLVYRLFTKVPIHQMFSQLRLPFDSIFLTEVQIDAFIAEHSGWLNSKHYFANYFLLPKEEHYWSVLNVDFLHLKDGSKEINKRFYLIGENHARDPSLRLRMFVRKPI